MESPFILLSYLDSFGTRRTDHEGKADDDRSETNDHSLDVHSKKSHNDKQEKCVETRVDDGFI